MSLAPLAALLAGLVLMGGFLVARWGNEPFERIRPGEVAAMEYVYAHDKPTVRLLWLSNDPVNNVTPAMPWGARDMERVQYVPTLAPRDPVLVSGLVEALRGRGPELVPDASTTARSESSAAGRRLLARPGSARLRPPPSTTRPELRKVLVQRRRDDVRAARAARRARSPQPDPGRSARR